MPPNNSASIWRPWSTSTDLCRARQESPTVRRWDCRHWTRNWIELKGQLADLSSRYTDRHPDVRKLKDQIAKTEKMRDQIVADLKAKEAISAESGTSGGSSRSCRSRNIVAGDGSAARPTARQSGRD